jgi:membrane-associated phospholipid phosphatase
MIRALVLALAVTLSPALAGAQSFASIFTELPQDFARLATPSNIGIIGGTGLGSLALHPKDNEIAIKANDADQFFGAGGLLGNGATQAAAGLGVYVVGRVSSHARTTQVGADMLRALIVSGALTDGIKLATNRTRPDGRDYSFPSGHTSSAFATAAVLHRHFGWKTGVPAYVVATYVGSSRMAHFRHFATDVLFGAGIGIASGRAATFNRGEHKVTVTPALSLTSAGINVSVN